MVDSALIDICDDGGILKEILIEGAGITVPNGVNVKVHYVGKLLDGTEFDSSIGGDPFSFTLGKGMVIKGWDEGVKTMRRGEKARLTCRSDYAYGADGSPPKIPEDATLVFEIEVLSWDLEDISPKQDGSLKRELLEHGVGFDEPKFGAEVDVTLVGECDGKEFVNSRLQFYLGEGIAKNIPRGVEKALKKMVKGEKSKIHMTPEYGFGLAGKPELGIPPSAHLVYTITLHSYEIVKDAWLMSSAEKIECATKLKEKGNKYYAEENYSLALKMWRKLCSILDSATEFDDKESEERKALLISGNLNAALALLKTKDYVTTREVCEQALNLDSNNVKALFRRGQALLNLNEPVLAKADFLKVQALEPDNKAAANQVVICQRKAVELKAAERRIYETMFKKLSDEEVKS